jgi:hypothetical protein
VFALAQFEKQMERLFHILSSGGLWRSMSISVGFGKTLRYVRNRGI